MHVPREGAARAGGGRPRARRGRPRQRDGAVGIADPARAPHPRGCGRPRRAGAARAGADRRRHRGRDAAHPQRDRRTPGPPARRVAMLGAHLDSVREGPGINDNGSGVAVDARARRAPARPPGAALRVLGRRGARPLRLARLRGLAQRRRSAGASRATSTSTWSARPTPCATSTARAGCAAALEQALRARKLAFDEISIGGASDHAPFEGAGISAAGLYSGSEERKTARQAGRYGGRAGRAARPLLPPPLRHARPRRPRRCWPSSRDAGRARRSVRDRRKR